MSGVGVLALLDDLVADMGDTPGTTGQQVAQVRDAVAELIEACNALPDQRFSQAITFEGSPYVLVSHDDFDAMHAALANVTGGEK